MPVATPVTTPVVGTTEPCAGILLLQVPPSGVELSVVFAPVHTVAVPLIAEGDVFTVIVNVATQPVASV